jgi:hypothetical protein
MEERSYIASPFLTLALDGGEWSASYPGETSCWYPHDRRLKISNKILMK